MSDQSYTTTFSVDRTADEVLAAINNPRAWWSEEIEGHTDQVDDVFTFRVKDIHYSEIQVIELVPGEKVVWRVLDNYMNYIDDQSEWKDTEIRFELFEKDGTTEVRFTHAGLVPVRVLRNLLERVGLLYRRQPAEPDHHRRGQAQPEPQRGALLGGRARRLGPRASENPPALHWPPSSGRCWRATAAQSAGHQFGWPAGNHPRWGRLRRSAGRSLSPVPY
jgi:hypothetical protein